MDKTILWILAALLAVCVGYILFLFIAALLVDATKTYTQDSPFYRSLTLRGHGHRHSPAAHPSGGKRA